MPSSDKALLKTVKKDRGKKKVTVGDLKKKHPEFRKLSDWLVQDRLRKAGMAYLPRRHKSLVPADFKEPRVEYARWVKKLSQEHLESWCYSDGTVFFKDRDANELQQTHRQGLGSKVWKMADGSESLYEDNVGPSGYNKSQGERVVVWGLLAHGILHVEVLHPKEAMNTMLYCELIEDKFDDWVGSCKYLVQDYEKCLRTEQALEALKQVGIKLVDRHPKQSQDLNAIENVWRLLRERVYETTPDHVESRPEFVKRLKQAVAWLNWHKQDDLWYYSTNQKDRAADVLKLKGARTGW